MGIKSENPKIRGDAHVLVNLTREASGLDALFSGLLSDAARARALTLPNPRFTIFVGPSGVGKGTAVGRFLEMRPHYHLPVSITTRNPRPGEIDGEHYEFDTIEKFRELLAAGEILTGDGYQGKYYADRWPDACHDRILLEVTLDAALVVQQLFPKQTVIFFFRPTGTKEWQWRRFLTKRLSGRKTETAEEIAGRVKQGIREIRASLEFPSIIPIFNHDTENSVLTIVRVLDQLGY